jgi:hypothetical protein
MSEWGFVGAAYGLTWAVLIAYALLLARGVGRARGAFERGGAPEDRA